jgi:ParB family chromosome partitioning protein
MNADNRKRGLGRGLDALFREVKSEEDSFAAARPNTAPAAREEQPEPKIRRAEEIELAAKHAPASAPKQEPLSPIEYKAAPGNNGTGGATPVKDGNVRMVAVSKLRPGKYQPRQTFNDESIEELADSIAAFGVLQPLIVRAAEGGMFEIIGGERRWRAAQKARVHEVPVVVRTLDDKTALEIALVENLQREDLNAIDEADGYQRLVEEFGHTQDKISQQLGKSRSHIANVLRLLKLPATVRKAVQDGKLTAGHARALIGVPQAAEIAAVVIAKGFNVRQTEKLIRSWTQPKGGEGAPASSKPSMLKTKDVDTLALEERMTALLGLKVTIESRGAEGAITVAYKTLDQLDDVLERLSRAPKQAS